MYRSDGHIQNGSWMGGAMNRRMGGQKGMAIGATAVLGGAYWPKVGRTGASLALAP